METNQQIKKSPIQLYADLVTIRDALKPFTQVSWTIKNLERKANIDRIDPSDYEAVYKLYVRLFDEVEKAYKTMKQIIKTNNEETKTRIHKNRE